MNTDDSPSPMWARPQTPRPPFPYDQREVLFENPVDGCALGGTLTIPRGGGRHPAILLITGSGPQDRNETVSGHRPFFVLSDYLTRAGFSVLRVDDRGMGESTGDPWSATVEVHTTDVDASLAFLSEQEEVDAERVGLIGHSEGGFIATLVASRSSRVAFIVSLAGPGLPGPELLAEQKEIVRRSSPEGEALRPEALHELLESYKRYLEAVQHDAGEAETVKLKRAYYTSAITHGVDPELAGLSEAELDAKAAASVAHLSPWMRSFLKLDPRKIWAKVRIPALILFGENDTQVRAKSNLRAIREAVAKGRDTNSDNNITLKELPGLNHLFQPCETGLVDEYAEIEVSFDEAALALIRDWLLEQVHGAAEGSTVVASRSAPPPAEAVMRPAFSLATDEAYDFGAIPEYTGSHQRVYDHIDANIDSHIASIQRWLRQPSISAQNVGITEMAKLVLQDLEDMGFTEAELVPTDGHPGVWGYYDAGAEKTLIVYLMYDVQPVNPEEWESPPFHAELVDHKLGRAIMARGATNQKGPERAFLNALESVLAVDGTLPVNIMLTAEGEEELGSPNYPQIIDAYEDRLRTADSALFPINSQRPDGTVSVTLGVKGLLYFEMMASGGERGGPRVAEIHSSCKAIVDSPPWRLVQALSTLVSADGNTILVPGYYDDIRPPNVEESQLINASIERWSDQRLQDDFGVSRWIDGIAGEDAAIEFLFATTMNIDGIWGGYTGEGIKTILPHQATAKVDSRLPPDIDPAEAMAKIRAHLDERGFADVELRPLSGYPAAQTSVNAPSVQAILGVFKKYVDKLTVQPRVAGSAPFYQFTERLNVPLMPAGLGFGSGAHGPNEVMLIDPGEGSTAAGLADMEKAYVDFIYSLAK